MNSSLLARFAAEARQELIGKYLGTPQWYPPVLAIGYARDRFLVAVMETPGPFCFLARQSPFEGAHAPVRLDRLTGAEVQEVSCPDGERVLNIEVVTRGRETLTLSIVLFGSAGVAFVARDGVPAESVGRGSTRLGDAPERSTAPAALPPFRLVATGRPGSAAPSPMRGGDPAPEGARVLGPFDSALDACEVLGQEVLDGAHETIIRRVTRPARRKLDALRRLATNLEADIETAGTHAEERRVAETLAAYQTRVPLGADLVELPDLYDPERTLTIELNPADPIHIQIEKRFRRVTKLEKGLAHSARRLALVQREREELDAALRLLERATSFTEALKLVEAMRAKFALKLDDRAPPIGSPAKKTQEKAYRQFDLDATWFAIVGRSNQENDEVTFKVAAPGDLWFHAHNVPGSHVVLRSRGGKGSPPATVVERAASIAAHYSKARHSKLVPVIYTQRKYVRKFRGANPGQVTCEREKMVMVPPRLPEGTDGGE
ncbi:MAG TPA: NFACT RNA binding domain-containing protein [Candidatus Krumholzibacteria bacterium]|nr:NFACT RNA binding domain-containing protein [Candidatus Krumholzibacteria bacterium]